MSSNSSSVVRKTAIALGLTAWVFLAFILAQEIIILIVSLIKATGLLESVNATTLNTVAGAIIYALAIALVIGVPWLVRKHKTTKEELGLQRAPTWRDIALVPAGIVAYVILTAIVTSVAMVLFTFVDFTQAQDTGFNRVMSSPELILAFISLVIVAPVAEEILFRGYLFGKLRKYMPVWGAIVVSSLLFAAVHGQWNVGFDVFALAIVLCLLRIVSGSLWPSILLHMVKNGVAFYFLFINPSLLSTLGG